MGWPSKFERRELTSAALRLVAERGPRALTIAELAKEVGAPTGSIYHCYESREQLLAELWMEVVEAFQDEFVASLSLARDAAGAVATALLMATWTREHTMEARLLLLHRRQDFIEGAWPRTLVDRAAALEPQIGAALRAFGKRAFGSADAEVMARLRFALLDAPLGGIKPYVQAGKPAPPVVDELVAATVRAVLEGIRSVPPRRER